VKIFRRLFCVLVLGFSLVGTVSAATQGPNGLFGEYLGNLGSVPLLSDSVNYISTASPVVYKDSFSGDNVHWFQFDFSGPPRHLLAHVESKDIDIELSVYDALGVLELGPRIYNPGAGINHSYGNPLGVLGADIWWLKIKGMDTSADHSYTAFLSSHPVPLPPAILLFGSAIAGFGVMGLKRKQRQVI